MGQISGSVSGSISMQRYLLTLPRRMATLQEKIFVNIPQLKNEKDWLVWKFQVQDARKAADQWQLVIGTANADADNYESKKQKAFYSASGRSLCWWSWVVETLERCGTHSINSSSVKQLTIKFIHWCSYMVYVWRKALFRSTYAR